MLYLMATDKKMSFVKDEDEFLMFGLSECVFSAATLEEHKSKQQSMERLLSFIFDTYRAALSVILKYQNTEIESENIDL